MASPTESHEAPSANELRAFAYRLLGRREYSVFELRQRLLQKWSGAGGIDALVEDLLGALVAENLLSDERFAESFVRSRVARHQGPLKIRAALRQKGVDDPLVAAELDGEARAHAVAARVKSIYVSQVIDVPDDVIVEAVEALEQEIGRAACRAGE